MNDDVAEEKKEIVETSCKALGEINNSTSGGNELDDTKNDNSKSVGEEEVENKEDNEVYFDVNDIEEKSDDEITLMMNLGIQHTNQEVVCSILILMELMKHWIVTTRA